MTRTRLRRDGTTEIIGDCPLCGSRGNFELNRERGLFKCWVCLYSGRTKGQSSPPLTPPGVPSTRTRQGSEGKSPPFQEIPSWVKRNWEIRGFREEQVLRYSPQWDGERLIFPVFGGEPWRRSPYSWETPKVLSSGTKGILGGELLQEGDEVVLTEGDYKACSIPLPWKGVALGGKEASHYQGILLTLKAPGKVLVLLDGGEEAATYRVLRILRTAGPLTLLRGSLPPGKGPDDIPRRQLVRVLLDAEEVR